MRRTPLVLKPVEQQIIVITGASSGIGLATAQLAAKCGANVVMASRNKAAIEQAANSICMDGGVAVGVCTDVTRIEDMETLRDQALQIFGRVDSWINNAGVSIFGRLMDVPLEEERAIFETNFWGVRHGCRVAVPVLAKEGGALINLGSEVSGVSIPLQGMYSATKHAVKAYTNALRLELEKDNLPISVTLVRPASINTPFALHARNRLRDGAPSLPPPIYDVDIAAKTILKCCEEPHRDAYVGSASKIATVLATLAPGVLDWFMKKKIFEQQIQGDPGEHSLENEGLLGAPQSEGQTRGPQAFSVSSASVYSSITVGGKRPVANPVADQDPTLH